MPIRQATVTDAQAIAQVKQAVWPSNNDDTSVKRITHVLQDPDHITTVALINNQIIGFVDSFITLAQDGMRRWEIDLLAVTPSYQGQGFGKKLLQATAVSSQTMAATQLRGLVRMENIASQQAFQNSGYTQAAECMTLFTSSKPRHASRHLSDDAYFIPVNTINYQGAWLEGMQTKATLQAAQAICTYMSWDVVGTLIPTKQSELCHTAQAVGFKPNGQFAWWTKGNIYASNNQYPLTILPR